jgi:hypothetical protein
MKKLLTLLIIVSVLVFTNKSEAAIARVQFKNSGTCDYVSSCAATFDSNTTSGNTIIVIISSYYGNSTGANPTISDSQSNTYTQAVEVDDSSNEAVAAASNWIFYAENITGGTNTVTASGFSGAYLAITILEYSGLATSASLDQTNKFRYDYGVHSFVATSTWSSNSVTTTQADELLIGLVNNAAVTTDIYTPFGSWTEVTVKNAPNNNHAVVEQIVSSTGTYINNGSMSASQGRPSASVATFKMASGGGGGAIDDDDSSWFLGDI